MMYTYLELFTEADCVIDHSRASGSDGDLMFSRVGEHNDAYYTRDSWKRYNVYLVRFSISELELALPHLLTVSSTGDTMRGIVNYYVSALIRAKQTGANNG